MSKELTLSELIDQVDLMKDEFLRIKAIADNQEIVGLCDRAISRTDQRVPVLKQRDDAEAALRTLINAVNAYKFAGGSARRKALRELVKSPILAP